MVDWEVRYKWTKLDEDDMAEHLFNTFARSLEFRLATEWPEGYTLSEYEVKHTALHEVFEARLSPIRKLAENRFVRNDEISSEIHSIVQLVCNVLTQE